MKCIVMASKFEAEPFIKGFSLENITEYPFPVFKNKDFILIISGIGKANAAMAAVYAILKSNPECIFNLGAAGAAQSQLSVGEFFHISVAVEYDRLSFRSNKPIIHIPNLIEGFLTAEIATQDQVILLPAKRKEISVHADLVDMECASIICACHKFNKPCYVFKFVSDTLEHQNIKEIYKNIENFKEPFFNFFKDIVLPEYLKQNVEAI